MRPFTYAIGSDTRITFPTVPDVRVRACLKAHGFKWSPSASCWWKRGAKGAADVVAALDKLMMPRKPDGACWRCQSPEGWFRNRGAASPVWCDACRAAIVAAEARPDRFDFEFEDRCKSQCGL